MINRIIACLIVLLASIPCLAQDYTWAMQGGSFFPFGWTADGTHFAYDARKSLGWVLGAAETNGTLRLRINRYLVATDQYYQIAMQVMPAYSATAPYNCPKTALMMTNAAKALANRINAYG